MRPRFLFLSFLLAFVLILSAQTQKGTQVPPNSPEEAALLDALGQSDLSRRLALLDAWVQKFPAVAAAAYPHYLSLYVEARDWDKALEFGRKAFEADPEDYEVAANLMKAAQGKGDNAAVVQWGSAFGKAVGKFLAARPEGVDAEEWKRRQEPRRLEWEQAEYSTYAAAQQEPAGARRIKALEQYSAGFTGGKYAKDAMTALALAYQQAGNTARMLASAQKAVELDPENEAMNLLLGETYLQQNRFELALRHARTVQKILTSHPQPENMSKAEWAGYLRKLRGATHSVAGRALMQQEKTGAAIPELNSASELLADNPQALAPVLYNLAFGYAKMGYFKVAKTTVARALQIPGPFQGLARELDVKIDRALAQQAPRR